MNWATKLTEFMQSTPTTGQWFVTIDASQISGEPMVDWQAYASQLHWSNLLKGTSEGEEADLTCWLAPLNEQILKLSIEISQLHPFSCTWFNSQWDKESIGRYWQLTTQVNLPNGKYGLFRFYDACILTPLQQILTPNQWLALSAPVERWSYIDRKGQLTELTQVAQKTKSPSQISLNPTQILALKEAGLADSIILTMQVNEHLPTNYDRFATYQQVAAAIKLLKQYQVNDHQQQYIFSQLTQTWQPEDFIAPEVVQYIARIQDGADIIEMTEAANTALKA